MRKLKRWLIGLGGIALIGGLAWAQVPATFNLTGNEIVRAGLPGGGSDIAVPVYVLRGGANHNLVTGATVQNTPVSPAAQEVLAIGAITTWNVTLPASPYTGQRIIINCPGGSVTTLNVSSAGLPSGVAFVGGTPSACSGNGTSPSAFEYSTALNTWFRVQ